MVSLVFFSVETRDSYPMDTPVLGHVLIFNCETFRRSVKADDRRKKKTEELPDKTRKGTDVDAQRLQTVFRDIGFEVEDKDIIKDPTASVNYYF